MKLSKPLLASYLAADVAEGFKSPDCISGPLKNSLICDTTASPPARAAALVQALNITEKLGNLVDMSHGAERLGLPSYAWWNEALHGVAASPGVSFNQTGGAFSHATSFANTITLAAAFDNDLVFEVADTISTEARAFSNAELAGLDYWTPNINPYKDPRWGRGHETPGEDPVHIKGYIEALLEGLEGKDSKVRKVIATCKHFAAYDLERWQGVVRYRFNAVVTSQDLSEYYLPPFQQCARDSNVGSFMCSYNALNGTPACVNTYLMDDILRKHWNWTKHNNYITSDCNAIQDFLPNFHNFSQTPAEAAADAYNAGTDTVCEVPGYPPFTDVIGAYNQSLLSEDVIDRALLRLYEGLIRAGYFDSASPHPYTKINWSDVNTPKAQALALQSATDGIVLLKNNGLLPLNLTGKTVALIGHWANATRQMLGGYSGIPPYYANPVYAATQLNLTFHHAPGPVNQTSSPSSNDTWTSPALSAASKSDIIFYFGGTDLTIAAEDRDRDSIAWPATQLSLLSSLAQLGKPLVVARLGDQVDDTPLLSHHNISAILWAGYPGQSGGTALFDIITGRKSPAGRLPVTVYPEEYTNQIPLTEMSLRPNENHPGRTYRWYPSPVLPFGHGLHYTTFTAKFGVFESLTIDIAELIESCEQQYKDLCPFPQISVWVSNAGELKSDYVALVFVKGEYGPEPYPLKTLVGYRRIRDIEPGSTGAAPVGVVLGDLARVGLSGNRVLYPGRYAFILDVGEGVKDEIVVELVGEEVVLEEFPQPRQQVKG
ncbi:family 3 putative glycoside hydrolase [Triangularia setosa]|uniref:xylan 1,4-beta-xylosidase n=1 Tax=Triangularia setosa TaxID=2587417 RepID=A0AAN6W3M2_9PEZI|nr:family 3 putative glycoside hydrolase [Podospora setosa]